MNNEKIYDTQEDIMVSICCIAYNQEKYIKQALESFLMQKTNFKYEIIVRDDASTDETAKIIKEYEKKYPEIIHGIYKEENTYSKGARNRIITETFEKSKGKYIAFCEGDDYWIDENKLQMQYDYMEKNLECTFCFHNAYIYDDSKGKIVRDYMPIRNMMILGNQKKFFTKDGNYDTGEIALLFNIPTASYFFKNNENWPEWFYDAYVGDTPMQLIKTNEGYAHYIDKIMSVYRINTGISMTDIWRKNAKNENKTKEKLKGFIQIYENINKQTKYKYDKIFQRFLNFYRSQLVSWEPNRDLSDDEKIAIKKSDLRTKCVFYLKRYTPGFYERLKNMKNLLLIKK